MVKLLKKIFIELILVLNYLNVGILLSKVSNTVTSPFNGAWFDSSSCLIADMLMLKSLKISVFPRTPDRSVKSWKAFTKALSKALKVELDYPM